VKRRAAQHWSMEHRGMAMLASLPQPLENWRGERASVTVNNCPRWVPLTSFDAQQLRECSPSLQLLRLFVAIPLWTWTPLAYGKGEAISLRCPR